MKALNTVFPLILTALFVAVACGDDEDTPVVPPAGKCQGTFKNLTEEQVKKGRHTAGACITDSDTKGVCITDVSAATQTCALSCLARGNTNDERLACTRSCLDGKLTATPRPSAGCQECYVQTISCTLANCLNECASSPDGSACVNCRQVKGCTPGFFLCSGLPLPD